MERNLLGLDRPRPMDPQDDFESACTEISPLGSEAKTGTVKEIILSMIISYRKT